MSFLKKIYIFCEFVGVFRIQGVFEINLLEYTSLETYAALIQMLRRLRLTDAFVYLSAALFMRALLRCLSRVRLRDMIVFP